LPIPLPDEGDEMDATKAFAELPPAVRARALALRVAIRAAWAYARDLGAHERARATMHVCVHSADGASSGCGEPVEIR